MDAQLVAALLATMSVCAARNKALIWLDEKGAALRRATDQSAKLRRLAWDAPPDVLRDRMQDAAAAQALSKRLGEARRGVADAPPLIQTLIARAINGRA